MSPWITGDSNSILWRTNVWIFLKGLEFIHLVESWDGVGWDGIGWDDAVLAGNFQTTLAAQAQASAPRKVSHSHSSAPGLLPLHLYLLRSQEEAP